MKKEFEFILKIVKEAKKIVSDNFVVKQKGEDNDLVTNVDIAVEQFLIDKIKKEYPTFDIVSEELNAKKKVTKNCFVIDPIDGTINFANGIPLWGIQIACVKNGKTIASAINLVKQNELFYADETKAYLNGKEIKVSKYSELKNVLCVIDGGKTLSIRKRMKIFPFGWRNFGGVCVSMAYVASGRIHGASFGSDKPWDYLPGLHLVEKAGGKIVDKKGAHIGACNQELADILEKETSRIVNPPNIFILHSLNGDTLDFWGVDVKEKMEDYNLKVFTPNFPIRTESTFDKFDIILSDYLNKGQLNEKSIVIAHSIGNPYFVRFCNKHKFIPQAYISVAGTGETWKRERSDYIVEITKNAIPTNSDLNYIKEKVKTKYSFYSDEPIPLEVLQNFAKKIGSQEKYLKGYSHFSGYDRIYKIPELIELLKKLILD